MSIRQMFPGSIVKPGFNPLGAQTTTYLYNLYGWGSNNNGQLGLGNTTKYSSPVQVGSLTDWLNISSGGYHSLAVKTDGTLWSWGYNVQGQLGLGNVTKYSSPKQVGALTNWLKVAGGPYISFAIKTDGTLWSWGINGSGQLGLGDRTYRSSPVQVGSLTTWAFVASGDRGSYAVKNDGTLWSWGNNAAGQLGLNNQTHTNTPTKVTFPSKKIVQMHGGGMYGTINGAFLVVCDDGTVYGAGFNETYALGLSYVGTKNPDPGPIKTFRENEFFGPSPEQITDSGRYPLILSGNLINGADRILNASLTASKTFTLGGTTFSNQIVYAQPNFTLSGYGIQEGTIATTIDEINNIVFLNKPLTADASFSNIRYDQRIRVYQADLCGYGTEMAQKIVTEDGTLYMSGWNQKVGSVFNFNYYVNTQNVSIPTFFDAKFK